MSHPSRRTLGRLSKKSLEGSGPVARLFATIFYTADVLISVRWFKTHAKEGAEAVIFVRYLLGTAYLPEPLAPLGYRFFRKFLPFPDLAIFIDIDPDVAIRRIKARGLAREMFETRGKHERIRRVAKALTAEEWVVVDNSQDGEGPFRATEAIVRQHFSLPN